MPTDVRMTSHAGSNAPDHAPEIDESRAHLRRLDLYEWFRWASVLLIAVLLTGGMFSLSAPIIRRDWFAQAQLNTNIWALFGLVLLFSAYTVYQQLVISRLRRTYASRVAMAATLEVLKPAAKPADYTPSRRREHERFYVDRRITLEGTIAGKARLIYGRTNDISEDGVGAVLPESLPEGEEVSLRLPLGPDGAEINLTATLRHRRGFYHGFEFHSLTEAERNVIRKACEGGVPLRWFGR